MPAYCPLTPNQEARFKQLEAAAALLGWTVEIGDNDYIAGKKYWLDVGKSGYGWIGNESKDLTYLIRAGYNRLIQRAREENA